MPVLVVGSIALDTIRTPDKKEYRDVPGGSCTYFSYCASFFSPVQLVGVVGGDFPKKYIELLKKRKIDLAGLEVVKDGKTFQWHGTYKANMNDRSTDKLMFGVLGGFNPVLPKKYLTSKHLFLACSQPEVQTNILNQMQGDPLVVCDTIEIYIREQRKALDKLVKRCHGMIINDAEARMMFNDDNNIRCAKALLKTGLKFAVVKKGEHGGLLATKDGIFPFPAYPLEKVADPTGAGDSFAGGFMGYLAKTGKIDSKTLRQAVIYGTTLASFTCEGIALNKLQKISARDVNKRVKEFVNLVNIPL